MSSAVLQQKGYGTYETEHPHIPVSCQLPGALQVGNEISISGKIDNHSKGFSVNLCEGPNMDGNVAFHYNPRYEQHKVVKNDKQNGQWGGEEHDAHIPFEKDHHYDMVIKVLQHAYEVLVNNHSVCQFKHRIPIERVRFLFIGGDISVSRIQFSSGQSGGYNYQQQPGGYNYQQQPGGYNSYQPQTGAYSSQPQSGYQPQPGYQPQQGGYNAPPQPYGYSSPPQQGGYGYQQSPAQSGAPLYNPPTPLYTPIPGGLQPGKMIYISGVPKPNASRFTINLASGNSENSDFGLHFDVRINSGNDRNVVIRTNKRGGSWGPEEREAPYFPFNPNSNFDLTILVEPNCYKIAVNNSHFVTFNQRSPFHENNHLIVLGDVQLNSVRFQ